MFKMNIEIANFAVVVSTSIDVTRDICINIVEKGKGEGKKGGIKIKGEGDKFYR